MHPEEKRRTMAMMRMTALRSRIPTLLRIALVAILLAPPSACSLPLTTTRSLRLLVQDANHSDSDSNSTDNDTNHTQAPDPGTVAPTNVTTEAPTMPPGPTSNATMTPTVAPTNTSAATMTPTSAPPPNTTTEAPTTVPPPPPPTPASSTPTLAPTKVPPPPPVPEPKKKTSVLRFIEKTIAYCILLVLGLLAFGAIMSNRYRIYFFLRGVWYTILRLDCTLWIMRKLGLSNYQPVDGSLNTVLFEDEGGMDLGESLLFRESDS